MAQIRINSTPSGEAPQWVREQWVGLILPTVEPGRPMGAVGVLTGDPDLENFGGYVVKFQEAIMILKSKSPEAAAWWEDNDTPKSYLIFGRSYCDLVT